MVPMMSPGHVIEQLVPWAVGNSKDDDTKHRRCVAKVMVEIAKSRKSEIFGDNASTKRAWNNYLDRGKALTYDTNRDIRIQMSKWLGALCVCAPKAKLEGEDGIVAGLLEMTDDDTDEVKEASLEMVAEVASKMLREIPELRGDLIKVAETMILHSGVHRTLAKSIGRITWALKDLLGEDQLSKTFVSVWRKLAVSSNPLVRLGVAYSLPAMALSMGPAVTQESILPVMIELMADANVKVRSTIAVCFHEVCKVLGPRAVLLTEPFVAMMYDFIDVSQHLIKASSVTFLHLCVDTDQSAWEEAPAWTYQQKRMAPRMSKVLIETIILFETHLQFRWRSHATFLSALGRLPECMPIKEVFHYFLPVLIARLREAAVEVVRIAAMTIVTLMNASNFQKHQRRVTGAAKKLGAGRKWNHRMAFLFFCESVLHTCSRRFFKINFFKLYCGLLDDPIPNVRLKAVKLLPRARRSLELPQDEEQLDALKEKLDALTEDPDRDVQLAFEGVGGVSVGFGKPFKKEEVEDDIQREKREEERVTTNDGDITSDDEGSGEVYLDRETEAQNAEIDDAMEQFKAEQAKKKQEQDARIKQKKKEDKPKKNKDDIDRKREADKERKKEAEAEALAEAEAAVSVMTLMSSSSYNTNRSIRRLIELKDSLKRVHEESQYLPARTGTNKKTYQLRPFVPGSRPFPPPEGLPDSPRPVRLRFVREEEGRDREKDFKTRQFERGLASNMDVAERVKHRMIQKEKKKQQDKAAVGGLFPSAVGYALDKLHEPEPLKNDFSFKQDFKKKGHVYWGYMTAAQFEIPPRPERVGLTKETMTGGKLAQLRRSHPAPEKAVQGQDRWGALTPRIAKPGAASRTERFSVTLPVNYGDYPDKGQSSPRPSPLSFTPGQSMTSMGMNSTMTLPSPLSPRPPSEASGRYSSMSMPAMWASPPPGSASRVGTPRGKPGKKTRKEPVTPRDFQSKKPLPAHLAKTGARYVVTELDDLIRELEFRGKWPETMSHVDLEQVMLGGGLTKARLADCADKLGLYHVLERTSTWKRRSAGEIQALRETWGREQAARRIQGMIRMWHARSICKHMLGQDVQPYIWSEATVAVLEELLYRYDRRTRQYLTRVDWENFMSGFKEIAQTAEHTASGGALSFDAVLGEHSRRRQTLSFPMVVEGIRKAFELSHFDLRATVVSLRWRAPMEREVAQHIMAMQKEILELTQYEHELAAQELARQRVQELSKKSKEKGGQVQRKGGAEEKAKKESAYEKKKRLAADEREKMMERLKAEEDRRLKEDATARAMEDAANAAKAKAAGATPEQHNMEWYMRDKVAEDEKDHTKLVLPTALGEKYDVVGFLGKGGFATVYSAVRKDVEGRIETAEELALKRKQTAEGTELKPMALKVSCYLRVGEEAMTAALKEMALNEVYIISACEHRNIISCFDYLDDPVGCNLWYLMEQCDGESLQEVVKFHSCLREDVTRNIMNQLLDAVDYLHNKVSVAHRDLKPDNVLLLQNYDGGDGKDIRVKVADFGLSTQYEMNRAMTAQVGTPLFFAPELFGFEGQPIGYTRSVDCWACGVILYFCLQATLPFLSATGTKERIAAKVKSGQFTYKHEDKCTEESDDLIKRFLTVDPLKRYTCKEALNHPWMTNKKMKEMERSVFDMMKDSDDEEDEEGAPGEGEAGGE